MTETIGNTTYTRERRTVLVAQPRWTPPAMPCGAWLPVKPLDTIPPRDGNPLSSHTRHVWLVRRNGTTARGMWIACSWNLIDGDWLMWADTAEFIGWRGML